MKKIFAAIVVTSAMLIAPAALLAGERVVPNVIAYQSLLFDDGGNTIADGPAGVSFRITDDAGQVLYEESQALEAIGGRVSALVGNGLSPQGAPTGGIPAALFDPSGARYLEVQVEGEPAVQAMEVAAVPYAMYSQECLSVAKGGVTGDSIAVQSLTYENLSDELITRLTETITGGKGATEIVYRQDVKEIFSAPESSASIGVKPGFVYSAATDLQGTLTDLDRAVKRRDEKIDFEVGERIRVIAQEVKDRTGADETLQTNITNETTARTSADDTLRTAQAATDSSLQGHILATSAHGVSGDIAGTESNQTLSNKILVAPKIVAGSNVNPDVGPLFDVSASEGVVVDGNLTVTGNIRSGTNIAVPNSNSDVTPASQVKAWGLLDTDTRNGGSATMLAGYNATAVFHSDADINAEYYEIIFTKPFADTNYLIFTQLEDVNRGDGQNNDIYDKTPNGFKLIETDGGTDRHYYSPAHFVCFGTLAN